MDSRLVVPGLFAAMVILALAGYAAVFLLVPIPVWVKVLIGLILTAFTGVMIYVFVQRARELKEEDKDDIGKY